MVYFKKGETGGRSKTTFGGKVGNFLIKNVKINFDFSNKYKRASYAEQMSSESDGNSPSKCVHKYGSQDVTSELKKTDCFAPLCPCNIFMSYYMFKR